MLLYPYPYPWDSNVPSEIRSTVPLCNRVKYSKSSVAKQNQHARWQKSQTDVDDVSRFGFWAGKNSRAHWGCRNRAQEILQQEPADGRNGKDGSGDGDGDKKPTKSTQAVDPLPFSKSSRIRALKVAHLVTVCWICMVTVPTLTWQSCHD